jgi:ribonucleoside-diphosphate reductase beta chain
MERAVLEIFRDVVEAEEIYAGYILHEPLLGYDKETHVGQAKWMVNIRANRIGLPPVYPEIKRPPVPWLDEQINLRKEKNFFETRVTEYKSAGMLDW